MAVTERDNSLSYSVRPGVVLKYLGQLGLGVAVATSVPLAWAAYFGQWDFALRLLLVILLLGGCGILFGRRPPPSAIQTNEALVVAALIFVATPLVMVFPLLDGGLEFVDALFESVSAITTTGLSTLGTVADRSESFLFTRAWMQWYGGLGIVVLSLALLIHPGADARRLALTAMEREDLITLTRLHARRVLQVYVALTVAGLSLLTLAGADPYAALLHTLAGVSTGGFSNYDDSMAGLGGWQVQGLLMVFAFAGAVSLALFHPAYYLAWRRHSGYLELRGLFAAALLVALALCLTLVVSGQSPWSEALIHGALTAVSAQTGTGFASTPIDGLDPASKLVLIVSMLIGGGFGSTAGGIKILRLLILLRLLQLLIQRACLSPRAVLEPRLGGRRLEGREIEQALLIILLFLLVVLLSWFPFVALGQDPLDSLFEVVSATATVGLSTGITAPELPTGLKLLLCLDMLLGRLEVVALVLVLYPKTWFGKRKE